MQKVEQRNYVALNSMAWTATIRSQVEKPYIEVTWRKILHKMTKVHNSSQTNTHSNINNKRP